MCSKISQNYGIMSAKINRKSTALPDMIFFLYLTGKKTGAKGKHLNIKSSTQSAGAGGQRSRHKTGIQTATGG